MQALVVQKDIFVTMRGLRKPLFIAFYRMDRLYAFYWLLTGTTARSARTGPNSVTAAMRNGR
jgi:hypothetical protein